MRKALLELVDSFIGALGADVVVPMMGHLIEPVESEIIVVIGLAGIIYSTYQVASCQVLVSRPIPLASAKEELTRDGSNEWPHDCIDNILVLEQKWDCP